MIDITKMYLEIIFSHSLENFPVVFLKCWMSRRNHYSHFYQIKSFPTDWAVSCLY